MTAAVQCAPEPAPLPADLLARLRELLGPSGLIDSAADMAAYLDDERGLFHGRSPVVLRPRSTAEVSAVVKATAAAGVAIVPQGGNTGYMGGAVPGLATRPTVLLSLSRLNGIRSIDPVDYTMVAEAGCILADLQAAAADVDRLFPLSLAAQGSCQIGGNLATNAGGVQVLRYGNARDLVLGLEVVLPDGAVWNGLRRLRKDNTGYDLKQLFMGAEGTLGIITAAVLKLFPAPRQTATVLAALPSGAAATALLARLRAASADAVTSFEYFHRNCLDLVCEHIAGTGDPFAQAHTHYALIELASGRADDSLQAAVETVLAAALEAEELLDAVLASSQEQAARLWRLRETIPEAQKHAGGCIKHDVSVQVSHVAEFLDRASALAERTLPGVRVIPFGHIGDGNVHFNLTQPRGVDADAFVELTDTVTPLVHDLVAEMGGSFSAEHGIGRLKKHDLAHYRPAIDLELMRSIKTAIDPDGRMNPGVLL